MIRKCAGLLACLLLLVCVAAGCGSTRLGGTSWVVDELRSGDQTFSADEVNAQYDFELAFVDESKFIMTNGGSAMEGTYTLNDGEMTMVTDAGVVQHATVSGGKISLQVTLDGIELVLKKK